MRSTTGSLRRLVTALAVLVAVLATPGTAALAATPAAAAPVGPTTDAPVAPAVEATVANGDARVIAVTRAPGEQVAGDIVADLPSGSAKAVKAGRTRQVALTVDSEGLDALKESPEVERILEDKPNRVAVDQWASTVGVPAAQGAGWSGSGRTIAVLDTGVQVDHPFLAGKVSAEACFSQSSGTSVVSLCPGQVAEAHGAGAATPCSGIPGCEHGTHVAGIAAGGPVSTPSDLVGVAPGASIIAVKVFTRVTSTSICGAATPCLVAFDSDIDSALDWLVQRKQASDPMVAHLDAVNLSLGGGLFTTSCDGTNPTATSLVNSLRSLGVATVAASGNNGVRGSMASPACISTVVSVGATSGAGSLAGYSNLTTATTILAPGSSITSSVPGSGYGSLTGTSMATPIISGALAALRGRAPATTVSSLVNTLQATADMIGTPLGSKPLVRIDRAVGIYSPNLPPGPPFGSLDAVTAKVGTLSVAGWAIDPDVVSAATVRLSLDGVALPTVVAGTTRGDVGAVYPGYGPDHGFTATLAASPGSHTVCATALNVGYGSDTALGCRSATVPTGPPFGSLDVVTTAVGSVTLRGWAIDPDTTSPITVHVYVDGGAVALTANGSRPDVGQAYPSYGSNHGYSATLSVAGGPHTVCAYAINVGGGTNTQLGCRSVTVPSGSPFGSLDSVQRNLDGSISVSGWSIDPDTATPINVLAYVAGNGYPLTGVQVTANLSRPDVGAAFPQYGAPHGYTVTVGSFTPSGVSVCVYGVNVGLGSTSVLGCRVVP